MYRVEDEDEVDLLRKPTKSQRRVLQYAYDDKVLEVGWDGRKVQNAVAVRCVQYGWLVITAFPRADGYYGYRLTPLGETHIDKTHHDDFEKD